MTSKKRFRLQDPTRQGFPQVVDTCAWQYGPWQFKLWPPAIFRLQIGKTYVVATFTKYCPDAQAIAKELCANLNEYGAAPPAWTRDEYLPEIVIVDNCNPDAPMRNMGHAEPLPDDTPEAMRGPEWKQRTRIVLHKEPRPVVVASISQAYCPGALTEVALLLERLNRDHASFQCGTFVSGHEVTEVRVPIVPTRFTSVTLEAE